MTQTTEIWTEEKLTNTTETWTEKKRGQNDRNTDRKRSMDRKSWQTRPKHGHNRITDRKSEKTRPKTWTEKAEKVRNTTEIRTENVANTTETWTENLTTTICCERNWVVSFLLKEQNNQTNKTQKDSSEKEVSMLSFSLVLAMSPTPAFLLLLLRPSLAGGGFNSRAIAGVHAYPTIAFTTAVKQI